MGIEEHTGAGRLYVVATPIGNLSDLSPRAAQTLRTVDVVAAEDTRVSSVLLRHVESRARMISAHAHNEREAAERVLAQLREGRSVALVSDAGTPAISDPGHAIVAAARAAGFDVVPIPGPSAVVALLSAAGLSDGPFLFEGFLPPRAKAREERLRAVSRGADAAGALLVFHEAPHRVAETLAAMRDVFGPERVVAIGRELTKTFEEIHVGPLGQANDWLAQRPERSRGEFVIAVDRAPRATDGRKPPALAGGFEPEQLLERLLRELSTSRAAKLAAELTGLPQRELYALALELRERAGRTEPTGSARDGERP